MRIAEDRWMTEVLSRPVFRVDAGADGGNATEVAAHARRNPRGFYYTKVATDRISAVRDLSKIGFVCVDVNVTFALRPGAELPAPAVEVVEATADDGARVLDIAASCFRYTRFHLDPGLTKADADHVKREWVANYVRRVRGDRLFVARDAGTPIGFLAALVTETPDGPAAVIDLVGVDTAHQRKRAGEALVSAFVAHYRSAHAILLVGTQVANIPSIRLYEKLGFSLKSSQYVLHLHAAQVAS